MSKLEDWIAIYDGAIPVDFCDAWITLFEDANIQKGEYKETWRRCQEFSKVDSTPLWEQLKELIKHNYNRYRNEYSCGVLNYANTLEAPNMYRYDVDPDNPNIFNFHADCWNFPTSSRQVSIIIYLNDVQEGGTTFFSDLNLRVAPKKGRILFFPSFYTFIHKGEAPISNSKYIIVTWVHFDSEGKPHAYRVHKF